jgi:hypothetical protein
VANRWRHIKAAAVPGDRHFPDVHWRLAQRRKEVPMTKRFSIRTLVSAGLAVGGLLLLSACGETPGCRAATGAGLGAAGGAVIGAVTGAPLAGAVIGGVSGAAVGGLTRPDQINGGPAPCR